MAERYADRAVFRTVYIKEAHPEDEWQMKSNEEQGVCYRQPRTLGSERESIRRNPERVADEWPAIRGQPLRGSRAAVGRDDPGCAGGPATLGYDRQRLRRRFLRTPGCG